MISSIEETQMNAKMIRRASAFRVRHTSLLPILLVWVSGGVWADCSSRSGDPQLHLVELYSSEGCNSCPPAEQWLSTLRKSPKLVGMEFHVDYWDSSAWKDPFSSHAYTERQEALTRRANHAQVYSPQIWIDGTIWKNWPRGTPPAVTDNSPVVLSVAAKAGTPLRATFDVAEAGTKDTYRLYAGVTESGLSRSVTGGENKGKKLNHDSVVRAFNGPLQLPHADVEFSLPADVDLARADIVGFVQDEKDGSIVQVVRLPLDKCPKS
jgi:hypothetical protein